MPRFARACAAMLAVVLCAGLAACSLRSSFADVATQPSHPAARLVRAPALSPGVHHLRTPGGRRFTLVVPKRLATPAPLVVALGGLGWTAEQTRSLMRLDKTAADLGALVAYPSAPHGLWNAGECCRGATQDDVTYLMQLRLVVQTKAPVDPRHTLLLGFSNGGMLAYHAACDDSGWSAIAVLGATLTADCRTNHPFAITNINGERDTVVPWDGGWSGYTAHEMPAVWSIDRSFAQLFRCGPQHRSTSGINSVRTWSGCSDGVTVTDIRVPNLKHHWPVRQVDHYDMGPVLWHLALG